MAARFGDLTLPASFDQPDFAYVGRQGPPPPWRRASRSKAALARQALAMEQAICVLEDARIRYTKPSLRKLVIDPPGFTGGRTVTFWPGRERLRVGRRPTKRNKDIHAFREALAAQGHRVPG